MTPPPVAGGTPAVKILRRLAEHNELLSTCTRRKAPWQLIGFEVYSRMSTLFEERLLSRTAGGRPQQVVG